MKNNTERFETVISVHELLENYFDFQLTHSKCRQCSGYKKTLSCPDFDFEPIVFWQSFSKLHLIVDRVSCASAKNPEEAQHRLSTEKARFDAEMRELEKANPKSYGLAAQECVACKICARLKGQPCVHPEIMRYGLESIGILAVKLAEDKFGFPVQWSDGTSVPDYYLLIGGVILKD